MVDQHFWFWILKSQNSNNSSGHIFEEKVLKPYMDPWCIFNVRKKRGEKASKPIFTWGEEIPLLIVQKYIQTFQKIIINWPIFACTPFKSGIASFTSQTGLASLNFHWWTSPLAQLLSTLRERWFWKSLSWWPET